MTIQELRQLTPSKLLAQLKKTRRELAVTRFHIKTGQSQDTASIKKLKKVIAQIQTLINNLKQK